MCPAKAKPKRSKAKKVTSAIKEPRKKRSPIDKAKDRPTPRSCINAFCFMCMGEGADKGWRWMIGNCTSELSCPIWPVRPHQSQVGKPPPKNAPVYADLPVKKSKGKTTIRVRTRHGKGQ